MKTQGWLKGLAKQGTVAVVTAVAFTAAPVAAQSYEDDYGEAPYYDAYDYGTEDYDPYGYDYSTVVSPVPPFAGPTNSGSATNVIGRATDVVGGATNVLGGATSVAAGATSVVGGVNGVSNGNVLGGATNVLYGTTNVLGGAQRLGGKGLFDGKILGMDKKTAIVVGGIALLVGFALGNRHGKKSNSNNFPQGPGVDPRTTISLPGSGPATIPGGVPREGGRPASGNGGPADVSTGRASSPAVENGRSDSPNRGTLPAPGRSRGGAGGTATIASSTTSSAAGNGRSGVNVGRNTESPDTLGAPSRNENGEVPSTIGGAIPAVGAENGRSGINLGRQSDSPNALGAARTRGGNETTSVASAENGRAGINVGRNANTRHTILTLGNPNFDSSGGGVPR